MTALTARLLDTSGWLAVPAVACLLGGLLFAAPARLFGLALPEPVFAVVPAFAWAIIRPSVLAPFLLVGMGVVLDLLWGAPIGFWPVCLEGAYAVGLIGRRQLAAQTYGVACAWYVASCAAASILGDAMTWLRAGLFASPTATLWQWLVTAALFPLAWRMIRRYEGADVRYR